MSSIFSKCQLDCRASLKSPKGSTKYEKIYSRRVSCERTPWLPQISTPSITLETSWPSWQFFLRLGKIYDSTTMFGFNSQCLQQSKDRINSKIFQFYLRCSCLVATIFGSQARSFWMSTRCLFYLFFGSIGRPFLFMLAIMWLGVGLSALLSNVGTSSPQSSRTCRKKKTWFLQSFLFVESTRSQHHYFW